MRYFVGDRVWANVEEFNPLPWRKGTIIRIVGKYSNKKYIVQTIHKTYEVKPAQIRR